MPHMLAKVVRFLAGPEMPDSRIYESYANIRRFDPERAARMVEADRKFYKALARRSFGFRIALVIWLVFVIVYAGLTLHFLP